MYRDTGSLHRARYVHALSQDAAQARGGGLRLLGGNGLGREWTPAEKITKRTDACCRGKFHLVYQPFSRKSGGGAICKAVKEKDLLQRIFSVDEHVERQVHCSPE